MNKFIEKLIARLEEYKGKIKLNFGNRGDFDFMEVDAVKEIVNELAEEHTKTKSYEIELIGCDDTTSMIMSLTEQEYEILSKVASKSEEVSTYQCMPIMIINPL